MRDSRDRRKASATAPAAVLRAVGVGAALAWVLLVGLLAGGCVWIVAKRSGLGATELRRWPAQRALQTTGVTDRDSLLRKQADPNRLAALPYDDGTSRGRGRGGRRRRGDRFMGRDLGGRGIGQALGRGGIYNGPDGGDAPHQEGAATGATAGAAAYPAPGANAAARAVAAAEDHGGADVVTERCYSLAKSNLCAPNSKLNRPPANPGKLAANASAKGPQCTTADQDHADARTASSICGRRLDRKNPCWEEHGNVSCLPFFFLLGEMKCGTTTMYKRLSQHPYVVLPRNKEVRYLMTAKYKKHSGSWYADNFDALVEQPREAITVDASPTTFNQIDLAIGWIAKWLPESKHILMLRDPVQRTYSHWRMGKQWLDVSWCYTPSTVPGLAKTPSSVLAPVLNEAEWTAQVDLGVAQAILRECKGDIGWGAAKPLVLKNETLECVWKSHMGSTVGPIVMKRQAEAAKRTEQQRKDYAASMRQLSTCSEMMLKPGSAVVRSKAYHTNYARWTKAFGAEQLKVVITEQLERSPDATIDDVLAFLGLPKAMMPPGSTHQCVTGKKGIMDEAPAPVPGKEDEAATPRKRAGQFGTAEGSGLAVGECTSSGEKAAASAGGAKRYKMDPEAEKTLVRFFAPYNARLIKLLGFDPGWAKPGDVRTEL